MSTLPGKQIPLVDKKLAVWGSRSGLERRADTQVIRSSLEAAAAAS